jgi:hypothetical protein
MGESMHGERKGFQSSRPISDYIAPLVQPGLPRDFVLAHVSIWDTRARYYRLTQRRLSNIPR